MSRIYHEGHRDLQQRFDSVRLADRLEQVTYHTRITEDDRRFIEKRDMFFLATADREGRPNCSYKGGDPGFVRVLDETTLVFPSYDGNGMFLSAGNTLVNSHVGMLFIDFEAGKRLRLNGEASVDLAASELAGFIEAQFVIRVKVREVFPNCPRYIHKYQLVERSKYVPHVGVETPSPAWKGFDWAKDVLPEAAREREPQAAQGKEPQPEKEKGDEP